MVETRATDWDVLLDGKRVGSVMDCGGFFRASVYGRRRRRAHKFPDFDTRSDAIRAVVTAVTT